MMKIIFICSDPKINNGEHFTPERELFACIESAALAAVEVENIIQAIDIADLRDIEDVTEQVAQTLTKDLFENVDIVPQTALGLDMHDFITDLEVDVAEDNAIVRSDQAQYASGRM